MGFASIIQGGPKLGIQLHIHNGLCPFFFWVVVKYKVYSRKPVTVRQSKNFIDDTYKEFRSNYNLCRTVCESIGDTLQECINTEEKYFEHHLD